MAIRLADHSARAKPRVESSPPRPLKRVDGLWVRAERMLGLDWVVFQSSEGSDLAGGDLPERRGWAVGEWGLRGCPPTEFREPAWLLLHIGQAPHLDRTVGPQQFRRQIKIEPSTLLGYGGTRAIIRAVGKVSGLAAARKFDSANDRLGSGPTKLRVSTISPVFAS